MILKLFHTRDLLQRAIGPDSERERERERARTNERGGERKRERERQRERERERQRQRERYRKIEVDRTFRTQYLLEKQTDMAAFATVAT